MLLLSTIAASALLSVQALPSSSKEAWALERRQMSGNSTLVSDFNLISQYWGQISPYRDLAENHFGVNNTGVPAGCGLVQAHSLQRHGQRYPTGSPWDGIGDAAFAQTVTNYTAANGTNGFSGPLSFLNHYSYQLGSSLLTSPGTTTEFYKGTLFWNRYGRLIYNATAGQPLYNATFANGTARPLPVIGTTSQSRILNSALDWAAGFFGTNATTKYTLVVQPEGGTETNPLASYDGCNNDNVDSIGYIGDSQIYQLIPQYLKDATSRLQPYSPIPLTTNDTFAMQSIAAYEYAALGSSDFGGLFTEEEWQGFEYCLDQLYYYDYSFGNPTGRAQGIGYLSMLYARLNHTLITASDAAMTIGVNTTFTNSESVFPTNQPIYFDASHDDILYSVVTALGIDYFKEDLPLSFPPNPDRHTILSQLTPFGTALVTEVYTCSSASPAEVSYSETHYTREQNGWTETNATHTFVRMRWNNAILPLATMDTGVCSDRSDGFCSVRKFLSAQASNVAKANYNYTCFANYTFPSSNFTGDGTIGI
ncbi:uncharacterized protein L969DRAFT_87329 [Mixia osmundae IAM 14324]|uniref:3-phytase n=1 Tax=Mixia osmundae (strain CBS 9802 / IAM 14324 / JCM 22182 / KY 12970) TaxID=764103 RepID=G7E3H3_MIXOS|nr:uncharacterized protein L969DRAFT_87329 [Mixia osmundae IAM 14324]KEI39370.1 hypothetical protein L969DRAFT_87329 [Mixia osmundae IAM 14324]GAA97383.1 hypothetical protein E5Q_04061 [Mixia osmundae IAM 14324]